MSNEKEEENEEIYNDEAEEKERRKFGLGKQQIIFCQAYVFLTGLNGVEAVKFANYQLGDYSNYPDDKREWYENLKRKQIARTNLTNPKCAKYIRSLQDSLAAQISVDRFYVTEKLKTMAERGSENIQIKALELLGKSISMFTDKSVIENVNESPAEIAKQAFAERMKKENVVPFNKEQAE